MRYRKAIFALLAIVCGSLCAQTYQPNPYSPTFVGPDGREYWQNIPEDYRSKPLAELIKQDGLLENGLKSAEKQLKELEIFKGAHIQSISLNKFSPDSCLFKVSGHFSFKRNMGPQLTSFSIALGAQGQNFKISQVYPEIRRSEVPSRSELKAFEGEDAGKATRRK